MVMRVFLLTTIAVGFPLQAQLLTPLAPAPAIPATNPGTVFPRGRDKNCPDGTALNAKIGRCLPTQQGRTLPTEETMDRIATPATRMNTTPTVTAIPASIAKEPNAKQLVQEAAESCSAYPGTVPAPMPGGYACVPQK